MQEADKKQFKIVVVDDNPDSVGGQMNEAGVFLKNRYDLDLDTCYHREPSGVLDKVNDATDIVIVDNNLKKGGEGIDAAKEIRQKHPLLDILLYTSGGLKYEELIQISEYSAVEVVDDRHFVDRLKTLIEKNLSKWSDIIFLRGAVISRIVELEDEVNGVILDYFLPPNQEKFRSLVLENRYISLESKKTVLFKIRTADGKTFEGKSKFCELQRSRNILAHCKRSEESPNTLIDMGRSESFDVKRIKAIFSDAGHLSESIKSFRLSIKGHGAV